MTGSVRLESSIYYPGMEPPYTAAMASASPRPPFSSSSILTEKGAFVWAGDVEISVSCSFSPLYMADGRMNGFCGRRRASGGAEKRL